MSEQFVLVQRISYNPKNPYAEGGGQHVLMQVGGLCPEEFPTTFEIKPGHVKTAMEEERGATNYKGPYGGNTMPGENNYDLGAMHAGRQALEAAGHYVGPQAPKNVEMSGEVNLLDQMALEMGHQPAAAAAPPAPAKRPAKLGYERGARRTGRNTAYRGS
mmetsp:Transcript_85468/g.183206  ORF Transcript_85468/g.183206 Transcript_85468/m.183206 type:complete len:160 (-) Transcript_85468:87-566(-)